MHIQPKPENFETWNDEMARRFDVDVFHNHPSPLVRFVEKRRVGAVLRMVNASAGEKILEVGCGAGHLLEQMPQGELYGVDLSETLLARAQDRLRNRATIQNANAESLLFADSYFDTAFCSEVLEHVLHPDKVIAEIFRVVKPGGRVVISIPHEKVINFAKATLVKLGLFNQIMKTQDQAGYVMKEKMTDEWHLRDFSLAMLRGFTPKGLVEKRVIAIPFPILSIHFAVQYAVNKHV